jgi:hypothetical protein
MLEVVSRLTPAYFHQLFEQAAEDHRVADVADEELVEQQHAQVLCHRLRHHAQRVGGVRRQRAQARMHLAHEAVEVPALARHVVEAFVEQVAQAASCRARRRPTGTARARARLAKARGELVEEAGRLRRQQFAWIASSSGSSACCAGSACQRPSATPAA